MLQSIHRNIKDRCSANQSCIALYFTVSAGVCVQLQPVDVLPCLAVQAAGLHGPVRAVGLS